MRRLRTTEPTAPTLERLLGTLRIPHWGHFCHYLFGLKLFGKGLPWVAGCLSCRRKKPDHSSPPMATLRVISCMILGTRKKNPVMVLFFFGVAVKCTWGHISHPFWDMLPFDTKSILELPWVLEDQKLSKDPGPLWRGGHFWELWFVPISGSHTCDKEPELWVGFWGSFCRNGFNYNHRVLWNCITTFTPSMSTLVFLNPEGMSPELPLQREELWLAIPA